MENLDKLRDKRTNNAGYDPQYLFYETATSIVLRSYLKFLASGNIFSWNISCC